MKFLLIVCFALSLYGSSDSVTLFNEVKILEKEIVQLEEVDNNLTIKILKIKKEELNNLRGFYKEKIKDIIYINSFKNEKDFFIEIAKYEESQIYRLEYIILKTKNKKLLDLYKERLNNSRIILKEIILYLKEDYSFQILTKCKRA